MRIAVVGGRLQGLEAVYLAKKAGWDVLLIDKETGVPAQGICDHFNCLDVNLKERAGQLLKDVDFIIPAMENREGLNSLLEMADYLKIPIALDMHAYAISSSKTLSDKMFAELGLPAPRPWPDCSFPIIAKPDRSSGSEGIALIRNNSDFCSFMEHTEPDAEKWVLQEFLEGPSFSIEIIGHDHKYGTYQITGLEMDQGYDCKRVFAPANLLPAHQEQFARIALAIAGSLKLQGIMDVEVVLHDHKLKVLEIDARLPSQTPTVVYQSTGVNLLELLADCFVTGAQPGKLPDNKGRAVIYEHVKVTPDCLEVSGENIISQAGPLSFHEGFFGADEALTDYRTGKKQWVATLIVTAGDRAQVIKKREKVIDNIRKKMDLDCYFDPSPAADTIGVTPR